jgi:UDP-GlcNAc:undecaprenyl-phosphate GlcNAc-1-phosphate transferase
VQKYIILAAVSFLASLLLTPVIRTLAFRVGAVDSPGKRKVHRIPTPRLGGVSIVLSVGLSIWIFFTSDLLNTNVTRLPSEVSMALLLGGALTFFIGVWDDIKPVPASIKFLFQLAAAWIAVYYGLYVEQISMFGSDRLDLGSLAWPITILWIVGITNAFNLVDGLDGLAAGLALIAAGTCATLFLLGGDASNALFLVILIGALAGFLWYNFNPATIFLGDSGSLVIGYVLAVSAIAGSQKQATTLAVLIPFLVFGLPIIDTFLAMLRRFLGSLRMFKSIKVPLKEHVRGLKRVFEADQGHIHHRLLAIGFSHRNAVLVLYVFALGLSLLATISMLAHFRNVGIILVIVGLAVYIGIHKLGYEELQLFKAGTLLEWYEQFGFDRRFFLVFLDLALIAVAYWASFSLKYEFAWSSEVRNWYLESFPVVLLIQVVAFVCFGLYKGVWRALGIGDLIQIVLAVAVSIAISFSIAVISEPPGNAVYSFFCIDFLLLAMLICGSRSMHRVLSHFRQHEQTRGSDVLIYGAGRRGQSLIREILDNPSLQWRPIGFIDDEPALIHCTINRFPVLGSSRDLTRLLESRPIRGLIISSTKIAGHQLNTVLRLCRQREIKVLRYSLSIDPLDAALTNVGLHATPITQPVEFSVS